MTILRGVARLVFITLVALAAPAQSADVAGVRFDEQIRLGDAPLLLNGAGVRSKFMFKVYALGLYVPRKSTDAGQVISQPGAKRIRIVTLRGVGADMFIDGLAKGLEKNHAGAELAALKPRIDQFTAAEESGRAGAGQYGDARSDAGRYHACGGERQRCRP